MAHQILPNRTRSLQIYATPAGTVTCAYDSQGRLQTIQDELGNVGTLIGFRVGAEDAEALKMDFGYHDPVKSPDVTINDPPRYRFCDQGIHTPLTLMETPNFHAWVKLAATTPPAIMTTVPPQPSTGQIGAVQARTRARHARSRAQIELVWYTGGL